MVAVSVVVRGKDFRGRLDSLVESIDQQSLPTSAFEVLVVDQGSTDGTMERLEVLASHRPNLRTFGVDDMGQVDAGAWLDLCLGDYVLPLRAHQRLFSETLDRLLAFATQNDLDAVAARAVRPGLSVPDILLADAVEVTPPARALHLSDTVVFARRALTEPTDIDAELRLSPSARVGVLASYPAVLEPERGVEETAESRVHLRMNEATSSWQKGVLHVRTSGVATVASDADVDVSRAVPLALLRHQSGLTFATTADGSLEWQETRGGSAHWSVNASVEVNVNQNELGEPMAPGLWEIDLQLLNVGAHRVATIGWAPCPPAIVDGTLVVPAPHDTGAWQLDVGATRWPLVAAPRAADGKVTESVRGSLLRLDLPAVHASGATTVDGEVVLDRLALPARLVTEAETARLEAYVSGLAGSPRIATRFGELAAQQTGLCLNVSGVGVMTVARSSLPTEKPTKPATPAKTAKAPSSTTRTENGRTKPAPSTGTEPANRKYEPVRLTRAQHLRHALPSSLEPLARRMAKSAKVREIYRKVAGL